MANVSVTVVVPETVPPPVLFTVNVYAPLVPAMKLPACDLTMVSALGWRVKIPLRTWVTEGVSVPSTPVTAATQFPYGGLAGST